MTQSVSGDSPIIVNRLIRISQSRPTAWRGETADKRQVHISYRVGWLSIELRQPVAGSANASSWRTVVSVDTAVLEAEHAVIGEGGKGRVAGGATLAQRVAEARSEQTAEMRRSMNGNGERGSRVVSFAQLQRWIEMLARYHRSPVELRAWFETESRRPEVTPNVFQSDSRAQGAITIESQNGGNEAKAGFATSSSPSFVADVRPPSVAVPIALPEVGHGLPATHARPALEANGDAGHDHPDRSGESEKIVALIRRYFGHPTEQLRDAVYLALKKRLEKVTARTASSYGMNAADIEDVVQEALRKFAEQEMNSSGIFNQSAAAQLCPTKLNCDIKGSVAQRSATWYRGQQRRSKIIERSFDEMPDDIEIGAFQSALECSAAEAKSSARELHKQIAETVSNFLTEETDKLTADAIESAMTHGGFNTAEL
ncbi:MAG: hypothetical protein H0U23_02155, partial [Blastocatellia bacterium]|nr:hypothetical protein [Blastocatellia bacterium]